MTRQGALSVLVSVTGGLAGIILGWPDVLLCSLIVLVALVALAAPLMLVERARIQDVDSETDFSRGDSATLTLRISPGRSRLLVVSTPSGERQYSVVRSGRERHSTHPLDASSRGCFTVGPFTLMKSDALGSWVRKLGLAPAVTYWVAPRISTCTDRSRFLDLMTSNIHNNLTSTVEPSDEFGAYQVGDEYRLINWKMTARTGSLIVRKLRPQKERLGLFVDPDIAAWNTSERFENSNGEANYEDAVDYAFGLAVHLMKARREFDFLSTDPSLAPLRGPSNERGLLRWGAEVRGAGELSVARTYLLQGVRELGVTTVIGVTPGRGCRLISEADLFPLSCTLMLTHPPTVTTPAK